MTCYYKINNEALASNFSAKTRSAAIKKIDAISNNNGGQIVGYVLVLDGSVVGQGWHSSDNVIFNQIN